MSPNFRELKTFVLRCGAVFYGHIAGITSAEPHYVFLLNAAPRTDSFYALVVASSRVEHVERLRKRFGQDTIAEIPIGTEPFLSKPTFVNCNDVKLLEVKYIQDKYDNRELKLVDDFLSEATLKKIIQCVRNSPVVSEDKKRLLP